MSEFKVMVTNSNLLCIKIEQSKFFFFDKQECLDFFEYLTISSRICNPPVLHVLGYYKKESHEGGSKHGF